ncbi:phosphotransferase enzyme family protein [Oerskovia sp. NPDC060338]|uniref:phosphotransferase enzyme family protein n=1 Tax=Oerskovia sp. NPDC060338 TaxID=3347100 RepID=UPI0036541AD8
MESFPSGREIEDSCRGRGLGASTSTQALALSEGGQEGGPLEEILTGGNSTTVVRSGDTVRRSAGSWTPTVQALLAHLRASGVVEVPEPLGVDDQGREVLSYLPGDVANYPLPDWLWGESVLRDAGALLRRVHDASIGFLAAAATATAMVTAGGAVSDGTASGGTVVGGAAAVPVPAAAPTWQLPQREPVEVVCHNDVAPYNLVFRDGTLVGLIDFDTASPGPRIRDLAYLGYRLAPFVADAVGEDGGDVVGRLDPLVRLDALVAAYGLPFSRREVLSVMVERLEEIADFTDGRAEETGRSDFLDHAAMYRADARRVAALRDDSPAPAPTT